MNILKSYRQLNSTDTYQAYQDHKILQTNMNNKHTVKLVKDLNNLMKHMQYMIDLHNCNYKLDSYIVM